MRTDPLSLVDGFTALPLGVHSGVAATSLQVGQCSWAVNTSFRGGYATSRPGIRELSLTFSQMDAEDFSLQRFQGADIYESGGKSWMLLSMAGHLFKLDLESLRMTRMNDPADHNASNRQQAWFCQAEEFDQVRDGQSAPWIWDGATLRRSDTNKEVQGGTCMEYGMGRVWGAFPNGRSFGAGDLVGGPSGTPAYQCRDAVLKRAENTFLGEGGAFSIGMNTGPIKAMRFVGNLDTSLGQGPLQVFTERAVYGVNCPVDRLIWKDVTYPIQTISLIGNGALAQNSTILVNGDIWYRALDGIRSYQIARRDFNSWVNAPMSDEVSRVLQKDDQRLLKYGSAVYFDNRVIYTCSPFTKALYGESPPRWFHRGLVVIDTLPTSALTQRTSPAWQGLWTGPTILQILKATVDGQERCFIVGHRAGENRIFELSTNDNFDIGSQGEQRIQWWVEGPVAAFVGAGHAPMDLKSLDTGDVYVEDMVGTVDFSMAYRPDAQACWWDWHSWQECATDRVCDINCGQATEVRPQSRYRMRLPTPPEVCGPMGDMPPNKGCNFQPRITITGKCTLKGLRLIAHEEQEDVVGECRSANAECKLVECCHPDLFSYQMT
jgi:hypothetical protein